MPFLANKKMNLAGVMYAKGDVVPVDVFDAIAPNRQGALLRTRLILEVEAVEAPKQGDPCPHCGGGPFARLAQHISLKHPDLDSEEE